MLRGSRDGPSRRTPDKRERDYGLEHRRARCVERATGANCRKCRVADVAGSAWDPSRVTADSRSQSPLEWAVAPHFDVTGKVLMGLVLAPAVEVTHRPDHRSQIDVEIHGSNPEDRADSSLAIVARLLHALDELRASAEGLAPKDWQDQYRDAPSYPGLFLEGFELHDDGLIRVLFDFGDLDLLILDLYPSGKRMVFIEA